MPTSIAHVIGGYTAVEFAGAPGKGSRQRLYWLIGLALIAANAPDLDFLPGLLTGVSTAFHRGPTHSVAAALLVPALLACGTRRWTGQPGQVFLATFLAYGSHVLLDLLIPDPLGDGGLPLLWPLSSHISTWELTWLKPLDSLRRVDPVGLNVSFVRTLLSTTGLRVFVVDALVVAPLLLLVPLARSLRKPRQGPSAAREVAELVSVE